MGEQTCSNHITDMKLIAISALAASAAAASLHTEWNQFKARFGKSYTATEEARRMAIFKENLAFVERHNLDHQAGRETYTVAINKFADLSNAEFRQQYLAQTQEAPGIRLNYQCPTNFVASGNALPDSVDWRSTANPKSQVQVTSVKDQGSCGSCWSFGSSATFEGAMCASGGKDNTALGPYYDMACNGGWIDNALYYIILNGG